MGLYDSVPEFEDDDDEMTNDHFGEERILYQNSASASTPLPWHMTNTADETDNCSVMSLADQVEHQRMIKEQQREANVRSNKKPRLEMRERFLLARRSYIFTAYFLFTIPLCLFLLIYAIVKRGRIEEVWYVCLEGLATVLLVFEFLFNVAVEGVRKMVKSIFSWLHLCAVFCCAVMFTILVIGLAMGKSARFWTLWSGAAYIEDAIVFVQCATNVVRIIVYLYQTRKRKRIFGKRVVLDLPAIGDMTTSSTTAATLATTAAVPSVSEAETSNLLSNSAVSSTSFCYPGAACKKSLIMKQHCEELCKTEHHNMYLSSYGANVESVEDGDDDDEEEGTYSQSNDDESYTGYGSQRLAV